MKLTETVQAMRMNNIENALHHRVVLAEAHPLRTTATTSKEYELGRVAGFREGVETVLRLLEANNAN